MEKFYRRYVVIAVSAVFLVACSTMPKLVSDDVIRAASDRVWQEDVVPRVVDDQLLQERFNSLGNQVVSHIFKGSEEWYFVVANIDNIALSAENKIAIPINDLRDASDEFVLWSIAPYILEITSGRYVESISSDYNSQMWGSLSVTSPLVNLGGAQKNTSNRYRPSDESQSEAKQILMEIGVSYSDIRMFEALGM